MPDLKSASDFISTHGAWALVAFCLALAVVWLVRKLVESQELRVKDAQASLPLLEKVSTAVNMQTKLIENFISEVRSRQ